MRILTPEQEAAKEKRERRNVAAAEKPGAGGASPVPFASAVASGEAVGVNALELEIAPFVLSHIPKAARFLVQCPEILVTHAIANKDEDGFDLTRTVALVNKGREEAEMVTVEAFAQSLASVGSRMTEGEAAAMLDLVHLAAARRNPDVTRGALDEVMNVPSFLLILRAVLRENPNLADPS